ncbi:hypothetical protein [Rhizobium sp. LjRoot254]|uniref:hypothetical protein n=1 Tax=Rhizobium sp. LjRoot254 TaxID=3342297 RepID=UPI003ECC88A2
MPRLEEVAHYIQGLWLILKGRPEGFGYLDFTERGFWRSWWSLVYVLPPTLLSYLALKTLVLSLHPNPAAVGIGFYFKLAAVDYGSTVITTITFLVVARFGGFGKFAAAIIIALNWLAVPLQWAFSLENLIQIYVPGSAVLTESAQFASLLLTAFLSYRIIDRIVGGSALVTATSLLTLYVVPQLSQYKIAQALALLPDL